MENNRLDFIDILKGIGILLVIFSHSGAENEENMVYVGGVFIPLFFVVSGYTYKHRDQPFLMLMKKKARRKALRKFRLNPLGYYLKIYEDDREFFSE